LLLPSNRSLFSTQPSLPPDPYFFPCHLVFMLNGYHHLILSFCYLPDDLQDYLAPAPDLARFGGKTCPVSSNLLGNSCHQLPNWHYLPPRPAIFCLLLGSNCQLILVRHHLPLASFIPSTRYLTSHYIYLHYLQCFGSALV
jgi:hypothetical protein